MRRMLLPFLCMFEQRSFLEFLRKWREKKEKRNQCSVLRKRSEHMYAAKVNKQRLFILYFVYPKQLQFLLVFMVFSLLASLSSICLRPHCWKPYKRTHDREKAVAHTATVPQFVHASLSRSLSLSRPYRTAFEIWSVAQCLWNRMEHVAHTQRTWNWLKSIRPCEFYTFLNNLPISFK